MPLGFQMTVCGKTHSSLAFLETDCGLVSLPASFNVWLTSPEARFLNGKFLWANWDIDELKAKAKEVEGTTRFSIGLGGWPFGETAWKEGAIWS